MQQGLLFFYRHISSANNSIVWRVHLPSLVQVSFPPSAWPQPVTTAPLKCTGSSSNSSPLPRAAVNLYTHAKIPVLEAATCNTPANLVDATAYSPNFDKDHLFTLLSPSFFKSTKIKMRRRQHRRSWCCKKSSTANIMPWMSFLSPLQLTTWNQYYWWQSIIQRKLC